MTTVARTEEMDRALRTLKRIAVAALVALGVSTLAGVIATAVDPATGSTSEAVLGFTAAGAGLLVAVFAIAAAIYAQVKNLWELVPSWIRAIVWTLIVLAIVNSVLDQLDSLL